MLATLTFAALAGLLSTLSPCVLPLIPIVLGAAAGEHPRGPAALAGGLALSFTVIGIFVATIGFAIGLDGGLFRVAGGMLAMTMLTFGAAAAVPLLLLLLLGLLSREAFVRWRGRMLASGAGAKRLMGGVLSAMGVLILSGADKRVESWLFDVGVWVAAPPRERRALARAMTGRVVMVYMDLLRIDTGQSLKVGGRREDGNTDIVHSRVVSSGGGTDVEIDWYLERRDGTPRIVDARFDGGSVSAGQRREYASILRVRGGGAGALIEWLDEQMSLRLKAEC